MMSEGIEEADPISEAVGFIEKILQNNVDAQYQGLKGLMLCTTVHVVDLFKNPSFYYHVKRHPNHKQTHIHMSPNHGRSPVSPPSSTQSSPASSPTSSPVDPCNQVSPNTKYTDIDLDKYTKKRKSTIQSLLDLCLSETKKIQTSALRLVWHLSAQADLKVLLYEEGVLDRLKQIQSSDYLLTKDEVDNRANGDVANMSILKPLILFAILFLGDRVFSGNPATLSVFNTLKSTELNFTTQYRNFYFSLGQPSKTCIANGFPNSFACQKTDTAYYSLGESVIGDWNVTVGASGFGFSANYSSSGVCTGSIKRKLNVQILCSGSSIAMTATEDPMCQYWFSISFPNCSSFFTESQNSTAQCGSVTAEGEYSLAPLALIHLPKYDLKINI
ncbi:hypothetical protein DFA_10481 [Cavenderia fasciculata]|uniref:MRH domain-containing protein n=1 Tax=Cavenderia fasciculata TaxID=261658 RepID=F4QAC0_CACFS|nr:uncharacterized protein DFA_10481 [Cavenderia fasciculata]EGG15639.1 hypothetical protein DFA_10481 [Cavenderia fasciculata]|eukprot:XP_004354381.1 hypothetical protein DFA_10481 [Cavenderia fasciculata]